MAGTVCREVGGFAARRQPGPGVQRAAAHRGQGEGNEVGRDGRKTWKGRGEEGERRRGYWFRREGYRAELRTPD